MKFKPTGKRTITSGKGQKLVISDKDETVQETWINVGGSFDTKPMLRSVGLPPFKLPTAGRKQLIDESYRLWKYDPLGGSIVRTTTFFVLGRGVVFQFDDDDAQFYANKFYKKNNLEIKLRAASDESTAFGEVFVWLRPKSSDVKKGNKVIWRQGDTQVTFIPPDNITHVETAEDDVGDVHNFLMEWEDANMIDHSDTIPHISKYDFETGNSNGCIIQMKLNAGNIDPFGHGDLIAVKEWLDNYQEYLRDGVIINKLYRSPAYDISIEDGTEDEVNAAIARYRGWSIGSNPVHNSREEWKILEFTGPNSSNEEARRALLLIIAAGVGFAEFMLADGSNSNLASSKSQQLPVIKKFEDRQDIWGHILEQMFQFALQAKATLNPASGLTLTTDREGDIEEFKGKVDFPGIAQDRDLEVAQTNKIAIEDGYMSPRTAASRLNVSFDREVEQERNDLEKVKELQDMKIKAGVMLDPTLPPPGKEPTEPSDSQGGKAEARPARDRSKEKGGANAPVTT
tara:strand:+ start:2851 stop:4389 length:1539 start_codon:yes stop_codon:yes gene_type:complete